MIPLAAILGIGEKVLDRVLPDPDAKLVAQAKLLELAQQGQFAELEASIKDMASARDREIKIATSEAAPLLNKIITPILALGITSLSFALFAVLIFVNVTPEAKDILIYILGVLSALMTQVCGYYFGSSVGSKDKAEELRKIVK